MRLKAASRITKTIFLLAGTGFAAAAIFAIQLGLDNDQGWGKGRILLLLAGLVFLFSAGTIQFGKRIIGARITQSVIRSFLSHKFTGFLRSVFHQLVQFISKNKIIRIVYSNSHEHGLVASWTAVFITITIYLWYITSGTMVTWTPYSQYFDKLADAFRAGQLALLEEPSEQLLAMSNPYDWRAREKIPHLWDASFFQGKYYFYWGPVPGILAALAKSVSTVSIEDQYLVFVFSVGQVVIFAFLLLLIKRQFFPEAPAWSLFLAILVGGLSVPVLWLVNRPHVYETAIAGGQFFMLLGIYAAIRCFTYKDIHRGWLFAAGFSWGAAIGCRFNLAVAVVFFCLLIIIALIKTCKFYPNAVVRMLWLAFPLLVWVGGLSWYNHARFGSITETGHRYQLTGLALPADYRHVMSIKYAIPGLYNYLFRPLQFDPVEFPFVYAAYIKESMWPFFIRLPEYYYYSEPVAGIFPTMPWIFLSFLPLLAFIKRAWQWLKEQPVSPIGRDGQKFMVLEVGLGGGFVLLLALLAIFISNSMRYLADISWLGGLLATTGLWYGLRFFSRRRLLRFLLSTSAAALMLVTISFGLLANFANEGQRFVHNNPVLYDQIARLLQP